MEILCPQHRFLMTKNLQIARINQIATEEKLFSVIDVILIKF